MMGRLPMYVIAALCFIGAGFLAVATYNIAVASTVPRNLATLAVILVVVGVAAVRAALEQAAEDRRRAEEARPRRHDVPLATPTEPAPPRLGDDPFRDPPRAPVIVVERTPLATATPVVATADADATAPKLLR
jgi:heme exporter protein D